ncbi:hypothetical protein AYJ54_06230 [Bradyrhizobium centrolobii]|uniref:Uncharacterized protein n=1 Tax=Bradyrhizobium centrolobii TaxID=1505087 RepID=A0A176YYE8_9BRAD|nr:hypothetical protein AYJ54_06230 [Bradyrhizobium centrolobii]
MKPNFIVGQSALHGVEAFLKSRETPKLVAAAIQIQKVSSTPRLQKCGLRLQAIKFPGGW